MSKRVRILNDSLNSYGTRVLTSGMNVEQYCRNPVLLYVHERNNVMGHVRDVKVEGNEMTDELMFGKTMELSRRYKRQFEFGSLKMVNAGLDIIEMNEDGAYLIAGRINPIITKSKLFEVSMMDIGVNDNALALKKDGKRITLDKGGGCPLPELSDNNQKTRSEMGNKAIALQLGLPETATGAEMTEKIGESKTAREEDESLRKEKDELTLANITSLVGKAVGGKRITTNKKGEFISLGEGVGVEKLTSVLSAMSPQVRLSAVLGQHGMAKTDVPTTYKKLNEAPGDKLLEMHEQQPDEYKRLYRTEYEMECEI